MQVKRFYDGLNAEDRGVHVAWRRKVVAFWGLIAVIICFVLALDASVTNTEQQIVTMQQPATFP